MIKHVVMWKLKDIAEGKTKKENAAIMKELLESLPDKIVELESAEVGICFIEEKSDPVADIVLTTTCQTKEALDAYATHPEHKRVVQFVQKVAAERRVVDYSF